ncbi:MAG TPA: Gfo/Idh/MocA family oxidoreductase [Dehalococcoidia bacterium]|nr:Gfo/Idh/MocA family oxidoreductase [Dehalococcoidia bacterium]
MKIGIIGAGAIARRGHLPAYRTIPEIEIVGIADLDLSLAEKVADEFGITRYVPDCETLLEDNSIELVDICTPTQTHLDVIKTAADQGKHILVEKPLSVTLEDAVEIQKIIKANDINLCVVHNWRYAPSVGRVAKRISGGYLGNIVTIHGLGLTSFPSSWTLNTWLYHQGGVLYDFGPHMIDMILYMKNFSPVKTVYAAGGDFSHGNMDFINYAVITIEFEDGSIVTTDISWMTASVLKFILDVHGTAGNILLDIRNDSYSEVHGFSTPFNDIRYFFSKMWRIGNGVLSGSYFNGANIYYKPLILDFINAVKGNGEIPITVDHAVMTNAVLEAAKLSILENRPVSYSKLVGED